MLGVSQSALASQLIRKFFDTKVFWEGRELSLSEKRDRLNGVKVNGERVIISDQMNSLQILIWFLKAIEENWSVIFTPSLSLVSHEDFRGFRRPSGICFFSSGTTGTPKLIEHTIEKLVLNAELHVSGYQHWSEVSTVIQSLPLYHIYGLVALVLAPLLTGKNIYLLSANHSFSKISAAIIKDSVLALTPSQVRLSLMLRLQATPKILSIGSAALQVGDRSALQSFYSQSHIYVTYGLTEAGPRVTSGYLHLDTFGTEGHGSPMGRTLPNVELRVLLGNGKVSSFGVGELLVNSPCVAVNLEADQLHSGFLKTGDWVQITEDGEVFFRDRGYHTIKKSGIRISAFFLEQQVRLCEGVQDCVVIKAASRLYDEVPVLFYSGSINKNDLQIQLKNCLPLSWWPEQIVQVDELPRKGLHKVDYQKVYAMLKVHDAGP